MPRKKNADPLPHPEICWECADKRKGIGPKHPVTCYAGTCQYCKQKGVTLVPIRDFSWPQYGIRAGAWD